MTLDTMIAGSISRKCCDGPSYLRHKPPFEQLDPEFQVMPLGWAIYGSEHGWYCKTGNYAGTVEALSRAGANAPENVGGTEAVKEVLRHFGARP